MDYHQVFLGAVESWKSDYMRGHYLLYTEADLQSALCFHILTILRKHEFEQPFKLHVHYSVQSPREKIDMVLGDNEVLVELKFEPNYPELPSSRKPVVFKEDIVKDFERMSRYANQGYQNCCVLVLDEDGLHRRAFEEMNWQSVAKAFLLLQEFEASSSLTKP